MVSGRTARTTPKAPSAAAYTTTKGAARQACQGTLRDELLWPFTSTCTTLQIDVSSARLGTHIAKRMERVMQEIDLKVVGTSVVIDFGALAPAVDFEERTREILPILSGLLAADTAWLALTERERDLRVCARAAFELTLQAALAATAARAELLKAIVDGSALAADHGFPEFADGRCDDV